MFSLDLDTTTPIDLHFEFQYFMHAYMEKHMI